MNIESAEFQLSSPAPARPRRAMVLSAGLGRRMRPITASTPKPLISVGGRALIDHALDRLERANVSEVVVNIHYLANLVRGHLGRRTRPAVTISDETDQLLDTGGGIARVLARFGDDPFYILNSDSLWVEGVYPNLDLLADSWIDDHMDALLLLSPTVSAVGYGGRGDFILDPAGRIKRRPEREVAPFVYTGAAILHPRLFSDCPPDPFSLNLLFDKAIAAGRLFGVRLDGLWLHVGTPGAIGLAERKIANSAV
jgi:MurNAc alpha-1-phosphate uridylyltransferase